MSRRVVHIPAEASPNVRLAFAQAGVGSWDEYKTRKAAGALKAEPTGDTILQGVLSWEEYVDRRMRWSAQEQCVGLDARFYEGEEVLLYPREWLDRADRVALELDSRRGRFRQAKSIGVDPGEGGANTALAVADELGLFELHAEKTADTTRVVGLCVDFMTRCKVDHENLCMDRGGGGKQHADKLRQLGYNVRTVPFGESVGPDLKRAGVVRPLEERREVGEDRYVFKNRRTEMAFELSFLLDPAQNPKGFGIPFFKGGPWARLRDQMRKVPRLSDDEGRYYMLPKGALSEEDKRRGVKTLVQLIGYSPDELDAAMLAVHGLLHKKQRQAVQVG